jgi:heptosyltransferase-2
LWALGSGTTFGPAKNWPVRHLAEFLRAAVRERERRVVLLGDRASAGIVRQVRQAVDLEFRDTLPGPAGVIDLTGRTDLRRLVGILKSCQGYVGNDSGLMHVAGALGCPTVGIFGSSNPDWTGPAGAASDFVIAEGFDCRPCYRPTCDQPEFCLDTIGAGRVLAELERCIGAASASGRGK